MSAYRKAARGKDSCTSRNQPRRFATRPVRTYTREDLIGLQPEKSIKPTDLHTFPVECLRNFQRTNHLKAPHLPMSSSMTGMPKHHTEARGKNSITSSNQAGQFANGQVQTMTREDLIRLQPERSIKPTDLQEVPIDYLQLKMDTSNLHKSTQNIDERVLECTICLKRIQNPVTLNCLHSYCLSCVENLTKRKENCPKCSYPIQGDDLKKLQPNIFLKNLIETIEQFDNLNQKKCVCEKEAAINYCQECRQYFCRNCTETHNKIRVTSKHKIHPVENLKLMTQEDFNNLYPSLCSSHEESLKYFCEVCNIPICVYCTIEHKEWEEKHKIISISEAYKNIKETAEKLKKTVLQCRDKLEDGLKKVIQNTTKLKQNKQQSLKDIDNHEKEMFKKIRDRADKLRNEVETKYKNKEKVGVVQMDELTTAITDIESKVFFLDQLLKSDDATVVKSSDKVIKALKDRTEKLPKTEPDDNGQIYYLQNKQPTTLQIYNFGRVTELRATDLVLQDGEPVTQGQNIVLQIIKSGKIEKNNIKATCTQPTGKTVNAKIDKKNSNGDYTVTTKCTSAGVCRLDVSVDDEPIKNSPMIIKVEKEGIVNTIQLNEDVTDVVRCKDDCLLVSCQTNKIHKYNQSGKYICDITLPEDVQVNRMCRIKNGNIVFSDNYSKCIKVCNMNGEVIKSFDKNEQAEPIGIHVNEVKNLVYVADWHLNALVIFDISSGKMIRRMDLSSHLSCPHDVHLTKRGNIVELEHYNDRLQLFDNKERFVKVIVKAGDDDGYVRRPFGITVDDDDNIIVTSVNKIQLFSSDGEFIKRIDKQEDKIDNPSGVTIISYYPRRIAVANCQGQNIKVFNY